MLKIFDNKSYNFIQIKIYEFNLITANLISLLKLRK